MAKQNNKEAADQQKAPKGYVPALKKLYKEEIVASLVKKFSYATPMAAPRLVKITINEGVGEGTQDRKVVEDAAAELALITGQKAVITNSRKDISNFKLRKGMPVGCKVTLRDAKMYEFLEKLIRVVLPHIRDFNGIADSMDGRGNYTLGIKEQVIFPEIDIDKNPRIHGMEVTFVTTAKSDEECRELLAAFGLPFKKRN